MTALFLSPLTEGFDKRLSAMLLLTCLLALSGAEPSVAASARRRASSSSVADWLVQLGKEYYRDGRYEAAQREFEKALLVAPDHPEAIRYLHLLMAQGQAREQEPAAGVFERAQTPPEPVPPTPAEEPPSHFNPPQGEVAPSPEPSAPSRSGRERDEAMERELLMMRALLRREQERAAAPREAAPAGAPAQWPVAPLLVPAGGIGVVVDGEAVAFERPVERDGQGRLRIPLRDVAAALGVSVISLGGGNVQLIAPSGEVTSLTLASADPAPVIAEEELRQHFNVRTRYDPAQRLLVIERPFPTAFRAYTVPKTAGQLAAEAARPEPAEPAAQPLVAVESGVPDEAKPSVDLSGSVTYSYDDPHARAPFRTLTTVVRGRAFDFEVASESVRKDDIGIFQHDYSYVNFRKPDLFIGLLDQRTEFSPLRAQFEQFSGVQVKKAWGLADITGLPSYVPRYGGALGSVGEQASTTLSWGFTEQAASGTQGRVTYVGQLSEARHDWAITDWLRLKGALLYRASEADLPSLSGTSPFPRNGLVSFGDLAVDLAKDVVLSGQLARSDYEPDNNPDDAVADWNWRSGFDIDRERYRLRFAYEFVGKDYASVGDPATYQDFQGATAFGNYQLTDRWTVGGAFRRYRDNVDDNPQDTTTENQALSFSTGFQPAPSHALGLRFSHLIADPSGPQAGSSSRSIGSGLDYSLPFVFDTRALASYEYFQTEAPAASDSSSHSIGTTLFKGFGRGSSWHVSERVRKSLRELEDDTLNLDTSMSLNLVLTPALTSYANASYVRDLTNGAERTDNVTTALGLRYTTIADTTLGLEYEIGPYALDAERGRWPRNWSILGLVTKRFGVATAPNFGVIEGVVFQDANGNGMPDAGEALVEDAVLVLDEQPRKALTDARGRFAFTRVVPGAHALRLDLSNLDPLWTTPQARRALTVRRRRTVQVAFPLVRGASLQGLVFIDANGDGLFQETDEPLEDIAVMLLPDEDVRKTDAEGIFLFEYLLPGAYTLRVLSDQLPLGYELGSPETVRVTLDAGERVEGVGFAVRLAAPVQQF